MDKFPLFTDVINVLGTGKKTEQYMFSNKAVFHWAYNNYIFIIDTTHNYVVVAPAGNGWKMTSEIRR